MANERYHIVAEDKKTNKRIPVTDSMSLEQAKQWKPMSVMKKSYKYFRVVRIKLIKL
jgi:hypothetical protein